MKQKRVILIVAVLASFVAFLDGSVVNVALPTITRELGGNFSVQQWVMDAYLITLGSLMLIAGSLSDLFGRKKIMLIGLIGFGLTSLFCALSPNSHLLIGGRALQGIAGALLVPSSLALIMTGFGEEERPGAIGHWTAWTGVAFLIGPLVGGFLVDTISWRFVFAINILPIIVTIYLLNRLRLKETIDKSMKIDYAGAILCAIGLGGTVFALIEQARLGWSDPLIYRAMIIGIAALLTFIWHENRVSQPMMPLNLFAARNFAVGNLATMFIYAAVSLATFIIVIFAQQVGNYSATAAGISVVPVTVMMTLLSSRFGALAGRYGSRWFMAAGPLIAAIGFLMMLFVNESVSYWHLLPGILLYGLGLSVTVAPLTTAVLGAIDSSRAGIASAINNAVARIAGLVAIAAISLVVGANLDLGSFHRSVITLALLMAAGGIISAFGIENPRKTSSAKVSD